MAHRLGVDVGGTFTDLLLVDDETGNLHRVKTPSTPSDPSQGVLVGVRRICEESGIPPEDVRYVMHGTTVATNALLEAKGARVGLITTKGFKQILHLARSQTPGPLAGWIIMIKPDPPAALEDTREANERMSAQGEPVEPVDRAQVEEIVRDLIASGVESLTVSLINSYANAAHEREIRDVIHDSTPRFSGDDLLRRAAGVPRVRAHADRLHELVRAPEGRGVRVDSSSARSTSSASRAISTCCDPTPA